MATLVLQPDAATGLDTYIRDWVLPDRNYGVNINIAVGDNPSDESHRGLVKFDLSSIPAGSIITSATLRLYCTAVEDVTGKFVVIHRSLVEWYEGDEDGGDPSGDGSTWSYRNYNGSVAWSGGAGGGSGNDYAASSTDSTLVASNGYYEWDLTTDVQNFVNGTNTNHGWWLFGQEGITSSIKYFGSSDNPTSSRRPELEIEYVNQEGSSAGTSTVTGSISAIIYAEGTSNGVATVVGILVSQNVAGSSTGTSTVTGDIAGLIGIAGTSDGVATVTGDIVGVAGIEGTSDGVATVTGTGELRWTIHGDSTGLATVSGTMWGKYTLVAPQIKFSTPLLYITDGTTKSNGQQNRFDLISPNCMFKVQDWRPIVLGDKSGGYWNDSPVATGRRLVSRTYGNIIEVFELIARSHSQDDLIYQTNQLYRWLESAADYWVSDWATLPIYLVARAPYETNERYAIVHYGSIPELENPYRSPFFSQSGAIFRTITLRLEHGIWRDKPPGQSTEVAISSYRNYTVTAWSS